MDDDATQESVAGMRSSTPSRHGAQGPFDPGDDSGPLHRDNPGVHGLRPGDLLAEGRYRVEKRIGHGAMGEVLLAIQESIGREVAIKVLAPELTSSSDARDRFFREARAACQLRHPNVVTVHDFGIDDELGLPYLVMEYVRGETLQARIAREGAFSPDEVLAVLLPILRALVAAHAASIVHRDLKPDNIILSSLEDGTPQPVLVDFGIAKNIESDDGTGDDLTERGFILGTPRYMSPEQIRGGTIDGRSDLYGVGCILHTMISGRAALRREPGLRDRGASHLEASAPSVPPARVRDQRRASRPSRRAVG